MERINPYGEFRLIFEPKTLADIILAIEICPVEISGLAQAELREGNIVVFGDALIFPQTCAVSGTDFDESAYGNWRNSMMREGRSGEKDRYTNFWWHSHVFAPTYWSGTDKDNIERWITAPLQSWLLSLVGNKYGSLRIRLDAKNSDEVVQDVEIQNLDFTEPIGKEGLRALMVEREAALRQIVADQVRVAEDPKEPFERILRGMFNNA
jgi:hypothetical protein